MKIRHWLALIACLILGATTFTYAEEAGNIGEVEQEVYQDLQSQIVGLIESIEEAVELNYEQIELIYCVEGNRAVYLDEYADIYKDLAMLEIGDMLDNEVLEAPFVDKNGIGILRKSKYYLPDVLYSICYYIDNIYNERMYDGDRKEDTIAFETMTEEVKENICLYEAILKYYGASDELVSNVYNAYLYVANNKDRGEEIGDELKEYLGEYTDLFCKLISYDETLAQAGNAYDLKGSDILPYELNKATQDNLLLAATSLVGKVRYVWGGGHPYSANINGINEAWGMFNSFYGETQSGEGWTLNVGSDSAICPIHGVKDSATCAFNDGKIYSIEEYLEKRSDIFNTSELNNQLYKEKMSNFDWSEGYSLHSLDGLDCSGYLSWVFNQITDSKYYGTSAASFIASAGMQRVEYGNILQPGDVFAWYTHIILIVGKYNDAGKVYVHVECTPNVVKFGVSYYEGAKQSDIAGAFALATEANKLFGNLSSYEDAHIYNLGTVGTEAVEVVTTVENEEGELEEVVTTESVLKYKGAGRYRWASGSEVIEFRGEEVDIRQLTASEVIEYLACNMREEYLLGYDEYEGSLISGYEDR